MRLKRGLSSIIILITLIIIISIISIIFIIIRDLCEAQEKLKLQSKELKDALQQRKLAMSEYTEVLVIFKMIIIIIVAMSEYTEVLVIVIVNLVVLAIIIGIINSL